MPSDWNVGIEGYRLFRKGRQERCHLCVSDQLECVELCLGMHKELTEITGVRIKGEGRGS